MDITGIMAPPTEKQKRNTTSQPQTVVLTSEDEATILAVPGVEVTAEQINATAPLLIKLFMR